MQILRTPDECFLSLPGFPFAPKYREDLPGFSGMRVHYIDEGPVNADVVWFFIGFGRSDKPTEESVYTFDFHRKMLLSLIDRLDLQNIRLVCQDWGGLLGLTLPMSIPDRFSALLVMNTTLGAGDVPLGDGFLAWRAYVKSSPDLDIAALMQRSTPELSPEEAAAYAAPFPNADYKAGVRRFPELVPDRPDGPGAALSRNAREWWKSEWRGRSLMAIGMKDPVLGPPAMRSLHKIIRNCPPPIEVPEAGHFVQEWGQIIAERAVSEFE